MTNALLPCLLDCHTACILKARGVLSNSSGYAQSFSFPWFGSFFQALENLFFPFKANWEKGKVKVAHSCLTCFDPWTIQFTEFSRPEYWSGLSLLQGIFPTQGSNPGPALQADSLPAEPQGKPKTTGVGSLSLLQGIFPDPGIEPASPALQVDSSPTELSGKSLIGKT